MKKILTAVVLSLAAGAVHADPVEGIWQTERNDDGNLAHVQIAPCGPRLCGTLIRSYGPDNKPIRSASTGKNLVWDMVPAGGGSYRDGQIWDPGSDKTYRSKMELSGDRLKVSGCVAGGLLCRGQTWVRVQ